MLKHCQKSCGICEVMQGMGTDPSIAHDDSLPFYTYSDINEDCEARALNEECQLNPDYMDIKVQTSSNENTNDVVFIMLPVKKVQ